MYIYDYHPESGEYLQTRPAKLDPLETQKVGEDRFLIPGNATTIAPPAAESGKARVFEAVAGTWSQVPDHRGETWWQADGKPVVIEALGNPADDDLLDTKPEIPPAGSDVNAERDRRVSGTFTFSGTAYQLDQVSQNRITAMGADARFAVLAGAQEGDLRWADPNADFGWIATDNSVTPMDAQTMAAFADAAKQWVIRHAFAALAIKSDDPIGADFASDPRWP